MSADPMRVTRPAVYLIDNLIQPATPGKRVMALTIGGVLVPTIVGKNFRDHYDAWMDYPTVPDTVKRRQCDPSGIYQPEVA